MRRIVLISCVSKKLKTRAQAKDLYTSSLFLLNLAYANTTKPDAVFILSAKYGLVQPHQEIEPYNVTLNNMSSQEIRAWADQVAGQLRKHCDLQQDHFIFLAGQNYRKHLIPYMRSYEVPMEGLSIGRQLQYLKRQLHEQAT